MIKILLKVILANFAIVSLAQTSETRYYNNQYLEKEKPAKTGKFSKTTIHNEDKSVTTVVKNVQTNEVVKSISYLGDEPVGMWMYNKKNRLVDLDYNFKLEYIKEDNDTTNLDSLIRQYCKKDSTLSLKSGTVLNDYEQINYISPKIVNEVGIGQFINKNIFYPEKAQQEGVTGKVTVIFTVTKEGIGANFKIITRNDIVLEKEAIRVLKLIKFSNPPSLNGRKRNIALIIPIRFNLSK